MAAQQGRTAKWNADVVPSQDPPVKVRDAIKRVGGKFQPAVLEIHGAMDYQFTNLINQISQRAKIFRGYSTTYFRRFCYESLGLALFKGQFHRCLNKATVDGWHLQGAERVEVTNTDDLGVTLSRDEAATQFEQSVHSTARTAFITGRREFRRAVSSYEADGFLGEALNSAGVMQNVYRSVASSSVGVVENLFNNGGSPHERSPGGSGSGQEVAAVGQDRSPVVLEGTSHSTQTNR